MNTRRYASIAAALVGGGLCAAVSGCAASTAGGVVDPVEATGLSAPEDEHAVQSRDVRLALDAFSSEAGARLTVPLFGDDVFDFDFVRREDFGRAAYVWIGRDAKGSGATAFFSINAGTLVGQVQTFAGRLFRFVPLSEGLHRLYELDPSRLDEACGTTARDVVHREDERDADTCSTDPPTEIDAMVLYTDDARAGAGSTATMEATIYLAVAETNQTYASSDVDQRLRLVHTSEISYAESGSSGTDLDRLEAPSDGQLDEAHTLRDAHAADVVVLITETLESGIAGRARIMGTVSNAFESSAFGVVRRKSATGNRREGLDASLVISTPRGTPSFLLTGRLTLEFDELLTEAWRKGGAVSSGIEREGSTLFVKGERAELAHLQLPPGAEGRVRLRFRRLPSTPKTELTVDVTQLRDGRLLQGGVSYTVDTRVDTP